MQAKGTTVRTLKEYVTETHGSDGYRRWLESLPPASQAVFGQRLLPSNWYPFEDAVLRPMVAMGSMFYGGDPGGAWREGRYTAAKDLRGVYRVFVRVASPEFLMRNTAVMWSTYYHGSEARLIEGRNDGAVMELSGIEPASRDFDHHVAGWIEQALEICGCSQIRFTITNPGPGTTKYDIAWG